MESIKTSIIAPSAQQGRHIEAAVAFICDRAGVCFLGIQGGFGIAGHNTISILSRRAIDNGGLPILTLSLCCDT